MFRTFTIVWLFLFMAAAAPAQSKGIDPALLAKAQAGDANAEFQIGYEYENGEGVPEDFTKAAFWFRKAAEQGNADAQNELALLYGDGKGVPQNYAEMTAWFHKAAEQGNAKAQAALGMIYESGEFVQQDYQQAAMWYRNAADQGNADAQFSLAGLYLKGEGVPQGLAECARWTRKAAEQGNTQAQEALGLSYAAGEGVPVDLVEAYFWLDIAAAGNSDTQDQQQWAKNRDDIAAHLTSAQLAQVQERAAVWFAAHQSGIATANGSSSETPRDTDTSPASSSAQNPATQEWVKAETDQIRAMVQAIKQCPSKVRSSAASTMVDGPPYNVTWDVKPSDSIRAPYSGYIEFAVRSTIQCSAARRQSSPVGCDIVERQQFPLVLRYEYDLSPDGLNLSKILVRRDNETEWSNRPNVSNYCWERAAQPTGAAK